jgi:hypothetical protein
MQIDDGPAKAPYERIRVLKSEAFLSNLDPDRDFGQVFVAERDL